MCPTLAQLLVLDWCATHFVKMSTIYPCVILLLWGSVTHYVYPR